jgi:hypothetical protein
VRGYSREQAAFFCPKAIQRDLGFLGFDWCPQKRPFSVVKRIKGIEQPIHFRPGSIGFELTLRLIVQPEAPPDGVEFE